MADNHHPLRIRSFSRSLLALLFVCVGLATAAEPDRGAVTMQTPAPADLITLENGLRLIVKENHVAPVAALRIYVNSGSIHEQQFQGMGISHVFEHLINGGTTTTRSEDEISELIDRLGGANNAYTSRDHTCYFITTDSEKIGDAIDLMADWMKNCTFPQNEIDRELGVVMEELHKGKEEPRRILSQALFETMYKEHPARLPIIGYESLVKSITREDILTYYRTRYVPNNLIVSCVGDFDKQEVIQRLKEAFGPMERRTLDPIVLPEEPPQLGRQERILHRPNLGAAYFYVTYHTVPLQHPDLYALDVLSYILSNGASSRLVQSLREEQRLVNMIYSYSSTPRYGKGMFAVHAVCPDDKFDEAVEAILAELERTKQTLVSQEELEKAINQKIAEDIRGKQTASDEAASYARNLLSAGNLNFDQVYLDGIQKVTAEDIRRVANTYFYDNNLSVVAMRPGSEETAVEHADRRGAEEQPIRQITLDNGLRILLKRNPNLPIVNLQALFLGGVRLDPEGQAGMSSLVASLMTRGTRSMSRAEIADYFDRIGGSIGGSSGNNSLTLSAEVLSKDFEPALNIFADILLEPTFPDDEFQTVQQNTLAAIARRNDDWQNEIAALFRESYFTSHPYGRQQLGTIESVQSIQPHDVRDFFASHAVPEQMVLTIFGDIDLQATEARLRELFGEFGRSAPRLEAPAPQEPPLADQQIGKQSKRAISAVYLGYPGTVIGGEDVYALTVLDSVLSGIGYPGGRLHNSLRGGDNDLVYLVHAFNFLGLEPGYFGIMAASSPDKMPRVIEIIEREVAKIRDELVPPEELDKAKTICITMENLSRQTNSDIAIQVGLDELYGLGYDHSKHYREGINSVTAEDVRRVARKYLTHHILVRTGPDAG